MTEPSEETLRAWLLHRLPEEQTAALERRVLLDEAFGTRLRAIETDLLDDYARDRLDASERGAVERWLLATPSDHERLRVARALATASTGAAAATASAAASQPAARTRRRRNGWFAFAAAAAVLLVVLYLPLHRSDAPSPTTSSASTQTIVLLADLSRSANESNDVAVRLPAADASVRLQLETATAADPRYSLRIRTAAREVFEQHGLGVRSEGVYRFVEATLPPATLAAGDYRVSLTAERDAAVAQEWSLRVRAE